MLMLDTLPAALTKLVKELAHLIPHNASVMPTAMC